MSGLEFRNVRKDYGSVAVVHGISLEVADGEFVALVGPSGCGKSTLLRMIAGLEVITGGDLLIGQERLNDVAPKLRDTAMVFQNYALYPHMTVAQNMSFALRIKKVPKAEIDAKVKAAAEIIGLTPYLDRLPRQLSGGQRQRVAMGRAIVRSPKVFLFDEPLSNLDAKLRVQMRTEIKSLHQRLKTTTIYVTHDQIEAMTMADRIVVMNAGRVEQMGPPLELYDNPANLFVASFIGSPAMNLYEGVVADGHFTADESPAFRVPVPAGFPNAIAGKVIYGIRPEHLRVVADGDGLPAVVRLIEPTGAEMQVLLDVDGVKLTGVFRDRIAIEMNRSIKIAPEDGKALLFEKSTGVRIRPAAQTDAI